MTEPSNTSSENIGRLNAEEADKLIVQAAQSPITDVALAHALKKLPDTIAGPGEYPEGFRPNCQKCKDVIDAEDKMGVAFGHFYHADCVPSLQGDPKRLREWFGGELP